MNFKKAFYSRNGFWKYFIHLYRAISSLVSGYLTSYDDFIQKIWVDFVTAGYVTHLPHTPGGQQISLRVAIFCRQIFAFPLKRMLIKFGQRKTKSLTPPRHRSVPRKTLPLTQEISPSPFSFHVLGSKRQPIEPCHRTFIGTFLAAFSHRENIYIASRLSADMAAALENKDSRGMTR